MQERPAHERPRPTEPILHADMDAFYASVEQRDDPSLRGRPVAVGGSGSRGVVAAASYEARRYGVRSALPMVRARRLCPDLVVVPADFTKYREVSKQVMEVFRNYTPLVEPLSLDEAFLDVSGAVRLFGPPPEIARQIRAEVRAVTGLPCSIGVGPSKFIAKLLSGRAKPDGLAHWTAAEATARLRALPVGDLWGAGPKTVERLERYGFRTIGDVADADRRTLERIVGDAHGRHLHALATGSDDRSVTPHEPAKSISAEETFEDDIDDPVVLHRILLRLSEKVGRRVRRSELAGRTITLKVRFSNFDTVTRSATLPLPTDRTHDIADLVHELFDGLRLERARVRLLGVGVSNLTDATAARQMTLTSDRRWEDVERVADAVAERFGDVGISYASLLDDDEDGWAGTRDAPTREDTRSDR
ncbi:MAG: DNA polymerase IV [Nitriliruptorales bacterium]|nr:DNA polymerase IV [Nitriliruptorales bacterium]